MPNPLIPGQILHSPDGRDWMVHQVIVGQHLVVLRRLDKRPREHETGDQGPRTGALELGAPVTVHGNHLDSMTAENAALRARIRELEEFAAHDFERQRKLDAETASGYAELTRKINTLKNLLRRARPHVDAPLGTLGAEIDAALEVKP